MNCVILYFKVSNAFVSFSVPKTCYEYFQQGAIISGNYEIDPDGAGGGPPFTVQCDFFCENYVNFVEKMK